jgi:hypothetical protein
VFAQRIHWPRGCKVDALMLLRAWLGAWKHRIDEGLHVYVCTQISMLWLNRKRINVGFMFFCCRVLIYDAQVSGCAFGTSERRSQRVANLKFIHFLL